MGGRVHQLLASTRARVLVGALVLLGGTIAITVVADRAVLLARLDDRIDDELAQEVEEFARLADGTDPGTGEAFGSDLAAIFDTLFGRNIAAPSEVFLGIVDGQPYLRSANASYPIEELDALVTAWASQTRPAYRTVSTPIGEMRTLVVPVVEPGGDLAGTFVVGRFPGQERESVDEAIRVAALVRPHRLPRRVGGGVGDRRSGPGSAAAARDRGRVDPGGPARPAHPGRGHR